MSANAMTGSAAIEPTQSSVEGFDEFARVAELFSSLLLDLPTEGLVRRCREAVAVLKEEDARSSELSGAQMLRCFFADSEERSDEDVLEEIARDRVGLVRGDALRPVKLPYESIHSDRAPQETIGDIRRLFAALDVSGIEGTQESPEQLGVEFAFLALAMEREREATNAGDADGLARARRVRQELFFEHLEPFALSYAKELQQASRTGFYRGFGLLMEEFVGCLRSCR